jgi:imidazole glycerol-phosphate synthase subunit HisF
MLRPRFIPCLLIQNGGLVKTVKFRNPRYVGDPINAVRVFNEKLVDEIMVIDIDATVQGREPNYTLIENFASEARMPVCYAGGVSSVDQIKKIIGYGVEKIALSSAAIKNPNLIYEASSEVGSQSISVVLDIKSIGDNKWGVFTHNGQSGCTIDLMQMVENFCNLGVGELVLYSIDRDGTGMGYDLDMLETISARVSVPITIIGGAGGHHDLSALVERFPIIGAGAGDMFVFKGKFKAVLITYPNLAEKANITKSINLNSDHLL